MAGWTTDSNPWSTGSGVGFRSPDSVALDPNIVKIVGKGLRLPFAFRNGATKSVETSSGFDKISGSISHILNTFCYDPTLDNGGELPKNPEFGSRLLSMIHEPVDPSTGIWQQEMDWIIKDALSKWEKRIVVLHVAYNYEWLDNHMVMVGIFYNIIRTQVLGNYIFPWVVGGYPTV